MIQELFPNDNSGAKFSECGKYRFILWRVWNRDLPIIAFIGLNPSTANESENDPTIRRVIRFAKEWDFGSVYMLNLFTYITPYPEQLQSCDNPLLRADASLFHYGNIANKIVFAWGNFKQATERAKEVIALLPDAYCLLKNKDGSPRHPLYVPSNVELIKY